MPQLTYDYRIADTLKANKALRAEFWPASVQLICVAVAILPILAGILVGLLAATQFSPANGPVFILGGIALGWLAGGPLNARVANWAASKIESAKALEGEIVSIELNEDALQIATPTVHASQQWSGIHRVFEKGGAIYFVVGMNAYFLPERAFGSPEARQTAVEFILTRLTPQARARSRV